jgi:hypothetical protein
MKYPILVSTLLAALALTACDKPTGYTGNTGDKGAAGSDGETVIAVPPAEPAPAN